MELTDKIYIGELVLTYGNLLTSKQLDAVKCYYLFDMSLSEIAQNEGITRQGAYDLVTKSTNILSSNEEKLGFVKMKKDISLLLNDIEKEDCSKKIKQIIERIKEIVE